MEWMKYNTGIVLEYPSPEGEEKFPIMVKVPAKWVQKRLDKFDDDGRWEESVFYKELVPDKDHPEFEEILKKGIEEAKKENERLWEEWEEETHVSQKFTREEILKAIFGEQ